MLLNLGLHLGGTPQTASGNPPIASGTFNPPDGNVSTPYSYDASALFTGGAVVSYSLNGILPFGLTLNTSTGDIDGTPTTEQTPTGISVTATNADGSATTNTADIDITLAAAPVAVADSYTMLSGSQDYLSIPAPGTLENDEYI